MTITSVFTSQEAYTYDLDPESTDGGWDMSSAQQVTDVLLDHKYVISGDYNRDGDNGGTPEVWVSDSYIKLKSYGGASIRNTSQYYPGDWFADTNVLSPSGPGGASESSPCEVYVLDVFNNIWATGDHVIINPFNSCTVHSNSSGTGSSNPVSMEGWVNAYGSVCDGLGATITSLNEERLLPSSDYFPGGYIDDTPSWGIMSYYEFFDPTIYLQFKRYGANSSSSELFSITLPGQGTFSTTVYNSEVGEDVTYNITLTNSTLPI